MRLSRLQTELCDIAILVASLDLWLEELLEPVYVRHQRLGGAFEVVPVRLGRS